MQILESTWRNVQNTDFTKICIRIHFRSSIFRIWCKPLVLFWNLPVTHVSIKIVQNLLTDCRFQIPAQADSSLDGNLHFGRVLLQADSRFRVPKRGQIAKKKVESALLSNGGNYNLDPSPFGDRTEAIELSWGVMRLEPRIKLLEAHVAALERRELWAGETVSFRTGTSLPVQRLSLLCIRTNRMNVAGR